MKTAYWIKHDRLFDPVTYECSSCGNTERNESSTCPRCGAAMGGIAVWAVSLLYPRCQSRKLLFVIGGMDGVRYKEYELKLEPGAKLFLYTDGVPEATNSEKELFGAERMLEALNTDPDVPPKQILAQVRASVDAFVKEAEQFDDLTMLCVEYRGSAQPG